MNAIEAEHFVIDLDESLAKINTFRLWTVRAFLVDGPTTIGDRIYSIGVFLAAYSRRLLGVIDHAELRRTFVTAWGLRMRRARGPDGRTFNSRFASQIVDTHLYEPVLRLIENHRTEHPRGRMILATAAPSFYATTVAHTLGLEACATLVTDEALMLDPDTPWIPNVGGVKLASVQDLLQQTAFKVVTDSCDDWPLISAASEVYLVKPSARLLAHSLTLGKQVTVVG